MKFVTSFANTAGSFTHNYGANDAAGFVGVSKLAFSIDGATPQVVDGSPANAWPTAILSSVLPTGASTDATLANAVTVLQAVLGALTANPSSIPVGANFIGLAGMAIAGAAVTNANPVPIVATAPVAVVNAAPASFGSYTALLNSSGAVATIKHAFADLSATGDLVAAVAGRQIQVLDYTIVTAGVNSVRFASGTSATAISSLKAFTGAGGISAAHSDRGLFQTNAGEKLSLVFASGTAPLGIDLTYIEY